MTTARLFLTNCLIWLLTLASPAGAGAVTMADLQTGVGDGVERGLYSEGSVPHALLHGAVGCAAAEGLGGNCASGAAAGIAQSVFAGLQEGAPERQPGQSDDEYFALYNAWKNDVAGQANLLGAVVGYTTSGGQAVNVSNAANIAQSGALNNYLGHTEAVARREAADALAECHASGACSEAEIAALLDTYMALQALDFARDEALQSACRDLYSAACALELQQLQAVVDSYVAVYGTEAALHPGSLAELALSGDSVSSLYGSYRQAFVRNAYLDALAAMPIDAATGAVALAEVTVNAIAGDETARMQLALLAAEIRDTITDPVGAIEEGFEAIDAQLAEAARLEAAGDWQGAAEILGDLAAGASVTVVSGGTAGVTIKTLTWLPDAPNNTADFMDGATEAGSTVRHGENSTAIGDDPATSNNFNNASDTGRGHNVIVHGELDYDELGGIPTVNNQPTNVAQIADAVRSNPNYVDGSQVCFASCWSGSSGTAQQLADELGVTVMAPSRPVAFDPQTGDFVVQPNTPYLENGNVVIPRNPQIEPTWQVFNPTSE